MAQVYVAGVHLENTQRKEDMKTRNRMIAAIPELRESKMWADAALRAWHEMGGAVVRPAPGCTIPAVEQYARLALAAYGHGYQFLRSVPAEKIAGFRFPTPVDGGFWPSFGFWMTALIGACSYYRNQGPNSQWPRLLAGLPEPRRLA